MAVCCRLDAWKLDIANCGLWWECQRRSSWLGSSMIISMHGPWAGGHQQIPGQISEAMFAEGWTCHGNCLVIGYSSVRQESLCGVHEGESAGSELVRQLAIVRRSGLQVQRGDLQLGLKRFRIKLGSCFRSVFSQGAEHQRSCRRADDLEV